MILITQKEDEEEEQSGSRECIIKNRSVYTSMLLYMYVKHKVINVNIK